jgi:hypothetical protein
MDYLITYRRIYLLSVALLSFWRLGGQTTQWATEVLATHDFAALKVANDGAGNCYSYSQFTGTVSCGNSTYDHLNGAGLLKKFDNNGNCVWAIQVSSLTVSGLKADAGHVYLSGYNYYPGSIGSTTIGMQGLADAFIVRLTNTGIIDLKLFGQGSGEEMAKDLAVDKYGNMYVTGLYSNTSVFGTHTLTSSAYSNFFVIKYDKFGNIVWATEGKQQYCETFGTYISVLPAGNSIIVCGSADGPNGGPEDTVRFTGSNVKFRGSTNAIWAGRLSGSGVMLAAKVIDYGYKHAITSIAMDKYDNMYCGSYELYGDPVLYKYDSSFNLTWKKTDPQNAGSPTIGSGYICVDATEDGDVFSSATALGQSIVSGDTMQYGFIPLGYLIKYNAAGQFKWKRVIASDSGSTTQCISVSNAGDVFIAGSYSQSCAITPVPAFTNSSGGYVAKFHDDENVTGLVANEAADEFRIYPNPSPGLFYVDAKQSCQVRVRSILSVTIHEVSAGISNGQVDLSGYSPGIYILIADFGSKIVTAKVLVQ